MASLLDPKCSACGVSLAHAGMHLVPASGALCSACHAAPLASDIL